MFNNCINYGIEAVLVKCSDLIQNIDYVQFVDDLEKRNILLKKYKILCIQNIYFLVLKLFYFYY